MTPTLAGRAGTQHDPFTTRVQSLRLRRRFLAFALVSALAAFAWSISYAPWAVYRNVEVAGASKAQAVQLRPMGQDLMGQPILFSDTAELRAEAEKLPLVRSAQIERSWTGTLTIRVSERKPALRQKVGSQWRLIDRDAVVLGTSTKPPGLPELIAKDQPSIKAAVAVLTDFPKELAIVKITAQGTNNVVIYTAEHGTVRWGSAEGGARKAEVLRGLISTKAKIYDVTAPETPSMAGIS